MTLMPLPIAASTLASSISTPQPVHYRPMYGVLGRALGSTGVTFVSKAALDDGSEDRAGLGPSERQDEKEAGDIGDEARGEQQRAAHEDQRGVGELAGRHTAAA